MIDNKRISIIVAVDEDGGFGKDGKIPWHFREDFEHFKTVTKNSICLMGKHTYTDMLNMILSRGKKTVDQITEILPGRVSLVITSDPMFEAPGALVVSTIKEAINMIPDGDGRNIFILGGKQMFTEGLQWTNTVYLTKIKNKRYNCDRFFPMNVLTEQFDIVDGCESDELYFVTYQRRV